MLCSVDYRNVLTFNVQEVLNEKFAHFAGPDDYDLCRFNIIEQLLCKVYGDTCDADATAGY